MIFEPTLVIAVVRAVKGFSLHSGSIGRERGEWPGEVCGAIGSTEVFKYNTTTIRNRYSISTVLTDVREIQVFRHTDAERSIVLQIVQGHP